MANVPTSYKNAGAFGLPGFEVMDTYTQQNLLAGAEPALRPATRFLLADSKTLAQFSRVGLNSASKLALATYTDTKATLTTGTGNGALTFTSVLDGEAGNDISIIIAAAGTASVAVAGHEITITPATGSNTATAVAALVNGDEAASLLVSVVAGGTGGSAPGTVSETQLAGGVDKITTIGVLAHAATSGSSNTTIYGEVFLTGNFNADADSPIVFDASFNTLAKKTEWEGNPNLIFRSRAGGNAS